MKFYLKPLSFLYDQVVTVKNSLFDRGVIKIYSPSVPVISIGNLTVGGTGKTPITDFCLKDLVKAGKKVAVISRSYRADAESPCLVEVDHPKAARYYGDEPVLLAQKNPTVAVYVGPSKWRTARYALTQDKYDVLIIDDGFQHRRLKRDLNVVILDATENIENYAVLPEGRARESWSNIDRADVILLSKCNLAKEDEMAVLESRLPKNKEILYFGYEISQCRNKVKQQTLGREELQGKKLFLVSAIARPDVFERMMREVGEVSKKSLHYRDHHQYSAEDAAHIYSEFQKSEADYLITTEKDAVKLSAQLADPSILWTASLEVSEIGAKGRLHEVIQQILR